MHGMGHVSASFTMKRSRSTSYSLVVSLFSASVADLEPLVCVVVSFGNWNLSLLAEWSISPWSLCHNGKKEGLC